MLDTFKKLPPARQKAILNASARVFARKGYFQANIADICKSARVSNGALYKYFKNKQDLYLTIFDYIVDTLREELFGPRLAASESVRDTIRHLFLDLVRLVGQHPEMAAIYMEIGSCSMNRIAGPLSRKIEGEARGFWIRLVRQGKEHGEIRPEIDEAAAAYSLDNHLNILAYSLVSAHFQIRFQTYFGSDDQPLTPDDRVDIMMRAVDLILG
jgi:AcrR family transcriptional regulator